MKSKLKNIIDFIIDKILIPMIVFAIWIGWVFLGIACVFGSIEESSFSSIIMIPFGFLMLIMALAPLVFLSESFRDTIEINKEIP